MTTNRLTLQLPATLLKRLADEAEKQDCSPEVLAISYICVSLGETMAAKRPTPAEASAVPARTRSAMTTSPSPQQMLTTAELDALMEIEVEPQNKLGLTSPFEPAPQPVQIFDKTLMFDKAEVLQELRQMHANAASLSANGGR